MAVLIPTLIVSLFSLVVLLTVFGWPGIPSPTYRFRIVNDPRPGYDGYAILYRRWWPWFVRMDVKLLCEETITPTDHSTRTADKQKTDDIVIDPSVCTKTLSYSYRFSGKGDKIPSLDVIDPYPKLRTVAEAADLMHKFVERNSKKENRFRKILVRLLPVLIILAACDKRQENDDGFARLCVSKHYSNARTYASSGTEVCRDTAISKNYVKIATLCRDSVEDTSYTDIGERYSTNHYRHWKVCRDTIISSARTETEPAPMIPPRIGFPKLDSTAKKIDPSMGIGGL